MQAFKNIIAVAALLGLPAYTAGCSTTQPITSSTDDAGTTARVKSRLAASSEVKARDIDVDTELGVVYLRGVVDSQEVKAEAERIAQNTKGVRQVVNQIALESERPPDGELDAWLTTKIKSRMAMDPDVRAMNIDVDTVEGVTYLTGIVEDKEERQNAERIASSVEGVERVVNNIKLEDEVYGPPDVEAQGPPGDPEQQKQKKQEQQKQEKEQEKEQEQEQEQEQEKAEEAPPPPPSPPQAG